MRDFDYSDATEFLESFYSGTEHNVELRALSNDGGSRPGIRFTRDPQIIIDFCTRWDCPGYGTYFAVATRRKDASNGKRESLAELTGVWVEIDGYKHGLTTEACTAALNSAPLKPTCIVFSGRGIHGYWLFREPLDVRLPATGADTIKEDVEAVLRQLCGVFAGDPNAIDITRVMRLPGTHNTREGDLRPVKVLEASGDRHELSDIVEMLDYLRPLLRAPVLATEKAAVADNPYTEHARRCGYRAPIDIEKRLAAMTHEGVGETSIHETQLQISASLVSQGADDDQIVAILLEATHRAAGIYGAKWNWRREEANLRRMITDWRAKLAKDPNRAPPRAATVIQLRGGGAQAKEDEEEEVFVEDGPFTEKPTIRLRAGLLHETATIAETALREMGAPLYSRSGMIVKPVVDDVEAARGMRTSIARLSKVSVVGMVDHLSRVAHWIKYDGRAKKWVPTDPPSDLAATILSRDGEWTLPPIVGVITTQTLRPDGSILEDEGYDLATRLLLLDPPTLPPMREAPTREDAEAALSLLKSLLADFCFVDDASRAVALSALITPVVRGAMSVAPLHAMRAPTAGSGKSYLVDLASAIATGQRCPVIAAGKTEEEQEKRLGAALLSGQSIVSIDNLNGELAGDALCQMVERPVVRVRPLGRSELVQVESKATVYATGNNIVIVGDMVRRVVLCSLDADVERPELRQFETRPLDTILNSRGKFVAACLTVVMAYGTAGYPDPCPTLASYEEWSLLVRSSLVWLGEADPVDTMETSRSEDPETTEIRNILNGWKQAIGKNILKSVSEVISISEQKEYETTGDPYQKTVDLGYRYGDFRDALLEVGGDAKGVNSRRLGWWLTRHKGRLLGGMKIVGVSDTHAKANRWKLVESGFDPV